MSATRVLLASLVLGISSVCLKPVLSFVAQQFTGAATSQHAHSERRQNCGVACKASKLDMMNEFAAMAGDMQKKKAGIATDSEKREKEEKKELEKAKEPEGPAKVLSGTVKNTAFEAGQDITGEVVKISEHGITVQLTPEITGFVHVSEMSTEHVYHPGEEVREGETIKGRVRNVEDGFVQLTMKTVGRTKFKDLKVGQEVEGKVKKVMDYGAIVDIGAEVDTMLHKTQIKENQYVGDAREIFEVGDKVKALIRNKDEKKRKVELSMKPKDQVVMPMATLKMKDLREGQELGGVISSVRKFGVFVNVGAEKDGLIHVKRINNGIVTNIDDLLKHGDRVVCRVFAVNGGKLELQLRSPLDRLSKVDGFTNLPEDRWLTGNICGLAVFGAFVSVDSPDNGPPVKALLRERWMKPGQSFTYGDEIKLRVLQVDTEKRQLFITTKDYDPSLNRGERPKEAATQSRVSDALG